jgi:hypothetical protein
MHPNGFMVGIDRWTDRISEIDQLRDDLTRSDPDSRRMIDPGMDVLHRMRGSAGH